MFSNSKEVLDHFKDRELNGSEKGYIAAHAKRYAFLLSKISEIYPQLGQQHPITILDIGPSFFSELLHVRYPKDRVMTLGIDLPEGHLPQSTIYSKQGHFQFDLNDTPFPKRWIKTPAVDLVTMAEVLEHLPTAPTHVLRFIHSLMRDKGFLILETPNAVTLKKRVKLLMGKNPFEMIREKVDNPGHFREYTSRELTAIGRASGFEVRQVELSNYFSHDSSKGPIQRFLRDLGPTAFRRGITLILQKPEHL